MATIVVYGGGFQPFHEGHLSSYLQAKKAFPGATFYVAASNDVKQRPIPFKDKQFLAQQAGVVDPFVETKQPINPQEILSQYDPEKDIYVMVRSERDPVGYTKKDGSPGYYQPYVKGQPMVPFGQHGYVFVTKKHTFTVDGQEVFSGSQVRSMYGSADDAGRMKIIQQLYPKSKQQQMIKSLLDKYLASPQEPVVMPAKPNAISKLKNKALAEQIRKMRPLLKEASPATKLKFMKLMKTAIAESKQVVDLTQLDKIDQYKAASSNKDTQGSPAGLMWEDTGKNLSIDERLSIIESYYTSGSPNLLESTDSNMADYFLKLTAMSAKPTKNGEFLLLFLALMNNKVVQLRHPEIVTVLAKQGNEYTVKLKNGSVEQFPSKNIREKLVAASFFFDRSESYDKFRTILSLKFGLDLPEYESYTQQGVEEGKVFSNNKPKLIGLTFSELDRLSESAGSDNYAKFDEALKRNLRLPSWTNTVELYGVYLRKLTESKSGLTLLEGAQSNVEQTLLNELSSRSLGSIDHAKVGDSVALLHLVTLNIPGHKVVARLNGFLAPKEIAKITNNGSSQQLEFIDGSKYPEKDGGDIFQQTQGWNMTKLFPSSDAASKAYTFYALVGKKLSDELDFQSNVKQDIAEKFDDAAFSRHMDRLRAQKELEKTDPLRALVGQLHRDDAHAAKMKQRTPSTDDTNIHSPFHSSQGVNVGEAQGGISVKAWAAQVRNEHGSNVKFTNDKHGGGTVNRAIARNSQGETVGVYNRRTGDATVFEPTQGVVEGEAEALQYATKAHAGQTRAGGDAYITHPMRVADHIRQYKQSHNLDALISAAYLHDTVEDTDTTQEALHDLFGGLVASLVKELTSDPAQIQKMGKAAYLSHKMAAMSSYALVIKLADRLDNVKDITTAKTPEWRAKYAAETNQILNYIEKTRALSGTHQKLISLIRAKLSEIDNPQSVAEDKDPCWKGYKQVGMKSKNGKKVPNCVPKSNVSESTDYLEEK